MAESLGNWAQQPPLDQVQQALLRHNEKIKLDHQGVLSIVAHNSVCGSRGFNMSSVFGHARAEGPGPFLTTGLVVYRGEASWQVSSLGEGVHALACLAPEGLKGSRKIFFGFWRWLLVAGPRPTSGSLLWLVELVDGGQSQGKKEKEEKEKEK